MKPGINITRYCNVPAPKHPGTPDPGPQDFNTPLLTPPLMPALKTHYCAQCEYDLSGLRHAGRCPECGNRYDRQRGLGVIESSAMQPGGGLWRRITANPAKLLVAAAAVLLLGFLIAKLVQDSLPLRISVFAAAALALASWWVHRGRSGG